MSVIPTFQGAVPGVYLEERRVPAAPGHRPSGIPAFLGYGPAEDKPVRLESWPEASRWLVQQTMPASHLRQALRGFYDNGGGYCHVILLGSSPASEERWRRALAMLERLDDVDIVCAPDAAGVDNIAWQQMILDHCDRHRRFAILDAPLGTPAVAAAWAARLHGTNGAAYYPWVCVVGEKEKLPATIPPSGHVAGMIAATDRSAGVHKAPANRRLSGVINVATRLDADGQTTLHSHGINALRPFPGRGIVAWGARTLSRDAAWTFLNVRRLFLDVGRALEDLLSPLVFEPNDDLLRARIIRDVTAYCTRLFREGGLRGDSPDQAFFVRCGDDINPPACREAGEVVAEIGLAPAVPGEFLVVRLSLGDSGVKRLEVT